MAIFGTNGPDGFLGTDATDEFFLLAGDDTVDGTGASILVGGNGADTMSAGGGQDILRGDGGADLMVGAAGADTITGGEGDDTMTGGADADLFRFESGSGVDVIFDFDAATEALDIVRNGNGTNVDTDAEIIAALTFNATLNGAQVNLGGGNAVVLVNVQVNQLDADSFSFFDPVV